MATLKAIKNNYDALTKNERFALYQQALHRRDSNEMDAIIAASPMKTYNVMDFFFLRDEIFRIDALNMLSRLNHYSMVDYFIRQAVRTKNRKMSDDCSDSVGLSAYLYTIETDAWKIVCDDFGFDAICSRELFAELCFGVRIMDLKDDFIRDLAYTEDEAREFLTGLSKRLGEKPIYSIKTLKERIMFYRECVECE